MDELLAEPFIPWQDVLRGQLRSAVSQKLDTSTAYPSVALLHSEGYEPYPGYQNNFTFNILAAFDTSGSMSEDDFIDCWGMNLEMEVNTTEERLEINFFGEDQQYLLEKKGAGLLSLQLILGKMLYKRGLIRRKLQVDCQGYRQRRENELMEIANRTADRVKKNGEDAFLNPMNPYERRIVHLALVDDQQVTTDSLGDGYMKKIRIIRL